MGAVLRILGHRLAALTPGVPVDTGKEPRVSAFFSKQCPLLRLITGLCEGADAVAGQVLETVSISPDVGSSCGPDTRCLETELAAVVPFDLETYRRSRPAGFQAEFDRQLVRTAWVLALDGIYDKPDQAALDALPEKARKPRSALADNRRARAYRAQSALLLRHSDLLIAAADPDDRGKAGGTLETVREALAFELPVIFIHTGKAGDNVYLIGPEDDLHSVLAAPPPGVAVWQAALQTWVTQLTADPDNGLDPAEPGHGSARHQGEMLLEEYFDHAASPGQASRKWLNRFRRWAWSTFQNYFRQGSGPQRDPELAPYATYRKRATGLNYHYSGLYRGAFLLNYAFAILAVILAAASLALLGTASHTRAAAPILVVVQAAAHVPPSIPAPLTPGWLIPTLLLLTVTKLGVVLFIEDSLRSNRGWW